MKGKGLAVLVISGDVLLVVVVLFEVPSGVSLRATMMGGDSGREACLKFKWRVDTSIKSG
jgi:hypothetical protein